MPIYEYQCTKCEKQFEYMQGMSEPPKKKCEACGGKLERLISSAGFILKGGGWYKDLYASPKPGSADAGEGGGSSGSKATKPADKAEKAEPKAKPAKKAAAKD